MDLALMSLLAVAKRKLLEPLLPETVGTVWLEIIFCLYQRKRMDALCRSAPKHKSGAHSLRFCLQELHLCPLLSNWPF
jgi:hypothetical protein